MNLEIVRPKLKKPYVKINGHDARNFIDFSISHTDNFLAIAVIPRKFGQIGIDIESIRNFSDEFKKGFMTAREFRRYKDKATLLWSAKEAYLKAIGKGLLQHPKTIEVRIRNQEFMIFDAIVGRKAKGNWIFINQNYILTLICLKI